MCHWVFKKETIMKQMLFEDRKHSNTIVLKQTWYVKVFSAQHFISLHWGCQLYQFTLKVGKRGKEQRNNKGKSRRSMHASAATKSDRHFASATVTMTNIFFSPSVVPWNCQVQSFVSLGAAGLSAQRGHVPFGLKEGRARCMREG
jgi:hypothetical protein